MTIERRTIEKSLKEKGFRCERNRDHRFYYFWHKGKKTIIRTKISTGTKHRDYTLDLISSMKFQLKLRSLREIRSLLECPMGIDEYTNLMLERGHISDC